VLKDGKIFTDSIEATAGISDDNSWIPSQKVKIFQRKYHRFAEKTRYQHRSSFAPVYGILHRQFQIEVSSTVHYDVLDLCSSTFHRKYPQKVLQDRLTLFSCADDRF